MGEKKAGQSAGTSRIFFTLNEKKKKTNKPPKKAR